MKSNLDCSIVMNFLYFSPSLSLHFFLSFTLLIHSWKQEQWYCYFFADNTSTVPRSVWQQILLIVSLFTSILCFKLENIVLVVHNSIDWMPCSIVFCCCCCCCYWCCSGCLRVSEWAFCGKNTKNVYKYFVYNFVNASVKIVDWSTRYINMNIL